MPVHRPSRNPLQLSRRKALLLAAASGVWLASPDASAAAPGAEAIIQKLIDDAFSALKDPALRKDPKKRIARLQQIVDAAFDWNRMSKSCLGPAWRNLNEAQRTEFVSVFKQLLANRYKDDLDRFKGTEKVEIVKTESPSPDLRKVKTMLTTASKERIPIDYTLSRAARGGKAATWAVEDVSIERVSMAKHYRETFANFLANNPFETMMKKLKQRLGVS